MKFFGFCRGLFLLEMSPGAWWKSVVSVTFAVIVGIALLSYIVDPHYRYRLPTWYQTVYYEAYATAPRLLRDMDYDVLMIGSSMCRNFYLNDIDAAMGGKSVKISASGATAWDLKKLFDTALEAKGPGLKKVIFCLDAYALNKTDPHWLEFEHMYDHDHARDYRYLFARKTLSSIMYLRKRVTRPRGKRAIQADPNLMFSTEYAGTRYSMEEVAGSARSYKFMHHTMTPVREGWEETFRKTILEMTDANPDIEFIFMALPYHVYSHCLSADFGEADGLLKQRSAVLRELLKRKNVKIYDFQCAPEIICDGSLYTDVQHFSSALARRLLAAAAGDDSRYRIRTPEDVAEHERSLRALIAEKMPEYERDVR